MTPIPPDHFLFQRMSRVWLLLALFGQGLFLTYIVGFYLPPVMRGEPAAWSQHRQVIDGYVAGDTLGNIQFGLHIVLAAILTLGGILQLWPALRMRFPSAHRWNGRLFVIAAVFASMGGLWLVWVRGSRLGMASALGISLNAVLILLFVALAWRAARGGDFTAHRRWALRAFLAVSGVWFLRIGLMAYGLLAIGLLGAPESSGAAFFALWSFGSYLAPLLVLQLWLHTDAGPPARQRSIAWGWGGLVLLTAIGIGGAAAVMWLPPLLAGWGVG